MKTGSSGSYDTTKDDNQYIFSLKEKRNYQQRGGSNVEIEEILKYGWMFRRLILDINDDYSR